MSLLLNQPSMLCLGKPLLVPLAFRSYPNGSSSSLPQTPPCFILDLHDFSKLVIKNANEPYWTYLEKEVSTEKLLNRLGHFRFGKLGTIGSSHGWVATMKDGRVGLQDDLNPVASDSDPKHIYMPPLVTLPYCQTEIVTNMSMSSSSPEEEDCVVAIKFMGPQLSLCRPAQSNPEWINITIRNPCFFSSPVMFSQRDGVFRIPGAGGHIIGSWDLGHNPKQDPKIQAVRFPKLPELTMAQREILHSCCTREQLVESPTTDETFLVKWYKKTIKSWLGMPKLKTEAVMVFKLDEQGNAVYTEDIGDLVIFLSKAEPFCVPASSFPGLCPNVVEIVDVDESATVNLGNGTVSTKMVTNDAPYWIPPQNIEL